MVCDRYPAFYYSCYFKGMVDAFNVHWNYNSPGNQQDVNSGQRFMFNEILLNVQNGYDSSTGICLLLEGPVSTFRTLLHIEVEVHILHSLGKL